MSVDDVTGPMDWEQFNGRPATDDAWAEWKCDGTVANGGPCRTLDDNDDVYHWNMDDYCDDTLEEHTWYDTGGSTILECAASVDEFGCGMMYQYDLAVECCLTCQPWQTRRPTPRPSSSPTVKPTLLNVTDDAAYVDDGGGDGALGLRGAAGFASGGAAGFSGPTLALIGGVLIGLCCCNRCYYKCRRHCYSRKPPDNKDDEAAKFGDAELGPRQDLTLCQAVYRGFYECLQALCWKCGVVIPKPIDRVDYLRGKFEGKQVDAMFQRFGIDDPSERVRWQDSWVMLDDDHSDLVDRAEFLAYFELPAPWGDRVFEIMRGSVREELNFLQFVEGMVALCTTDRKACEDFSFRLISRFGANTHAPEDDMCLDVKDVENFLLDRGYDRDADAEVNDPDRTFERAKAKTRSLKIAGFMDEDGSGGVSKKEFLEFSNENFIFLALGHVYQEMLRKKQFGEAYWVELTKRLANRGRDATVLGSMRSFRGSLSAALAKAKRRQSRKSVVVFRTAGQRDERNDGGFEGGEFAAAAEKAPDDAPRRLTSSLNPFGSKRLQGAARLEAEFFSGIRRFAAQHYPRKPPEGWLPYFRDDFGFIYARLRELKQQRKQISDSALKLRMRMSEDLCRKFLDIIEDLATDSTTLRGSFYRWKGKTLRRNWDERPIHADITERLSRTRMGAELAEEALEEHVRRAEQGEGFEDPKTLDRAASGAAAEQRKRRESLARARGAPEEPQHVAIVVQPAPTRGIPVIVEETGSAGSGSSRRTHNTPKMTPRVEDAYGLPPLPLRANPIYRSVRRRAARRRSAAAREYAERRGRGRKLPAADATVVVRASTASPARGGRRDLLRPARRGRAPPSSPSSSPGAGPSSTKVARLLRCCAVDLRGVCAAKL
ncbi:hypothetical protein JL721_3160 [Aureococcus anophagefferens]|nr:hypothetical protein JL721_3160 [Aureococcus anophagefferens]